MVCLTYRCGCREEHEGGPILRRCPVHNEAPASVFVASPKALKLAYGVESAPVPAGGLFYPNLGAAA